MNGQHLDTPITFALFTDLKSAIAMIKCNHVTKHSRLIMALTNVVDDKLIASNNNPLYLKLLNYLRTDIDIEDMGIAHWYLQGILLQNKDNLIVLNQS